MHSEQAQSKELRFESSQLNVGNMHIGQTKPIWIILLQYWNYIQPPQSYFVLQPKNNHINYRSVKMT